MLHYAHLSSSIQSCMFLSVLSVLIQPALAQQGGVLLEPGDTLDQIVAKAVQVRPHARQIAWQEKEFTAFVHFGMNSFTNAEWGSGKEKPEQFMPKTLTLAGFTYLPRQDGADGGLVAKYEFYVAEDSNRWGDPAAKGEFANILNNPILQRVMFDKPLSGRYIRLHALASPNNKPWAGAAEIDVIEARD